MNIIKIALILVSFMLTKTILYAQDDTLVYCFIGDKPYDRYDNEVNRDDTVIFILKSSDLIRHYQFGEIIIRRVEYRRLLSPYLDNEVLDTLHFNNQFIDPIIEIPLKKYISIDGYEYSKLLLIDIQDIYEKTDNKLNKIEDPQFKLKFDFHIIGW